MLKSKGFVSFILATVLVFGSVITPAAATTSSVSHAKGTLAEKERTLSEVKVLYSNAKTRKGNSEARLTELGGTLEQAQVDLGTYPSKYEEAKARIQSQLAQQMIDLQEEYEETQEDIENLETENEELEAQIAEDEAKKEALEDEKAELNQELEELETERGTVSTLEDEIEKLESRRAEILEMLNAEEDLGEASDSDEITESDVEAIGDAETTVEDSKNELEEELIKVEEELASKREELREKKETLDETVSAIDEKHGSVENLEGEVEALEAKIAPLEQDVEEMLAELDAVTEELEAKRKALEASVENAEILLERVGIDYVDSLSAGYENSSKSYNKTIDEYFTWYTQNVATLKNTDYLNKSTNSKLNQYGAYYYDSKTKSWKRDLISQTSNYAALRSDYYSAFTVENLLLSMDYIDEINTIRQNEAICKSQAKSKGMSSIPVLKVAASSMKYTALEAATYDLRYKTGSSEAAHLLFYDQNNQDAANANARAENLNLGYDTAAEGWYYNEIADYRKLLKGTPASKLGQTGHAKNLLNVSYNATSLMTFKGVSNARVNGQSLYKVSNTSQLVTTAQFRKGLLALQKQRQADLASKQAELQSVLTAIEENNLRREEVLLNMEADLEAAASEEEARVTEETRAMLADKVMDTEGLEGELLEIAEENNATIETIATVSGQIAGEEIRHERYEKVYSYYNTKLERIQKERDAAKAAYDKAVKAQTAKAISSAKAKKVKTIKVKSAKRKLKISWSKTSGATKYQVQIRLKGKKYKTVKTTTGSSFTSSKLKKGKYYQVRVRTVTKVNGKYYYGVWKTSKNYKVK